MIRKDGYIMDDWGFPTVKNVFLKKSRLTIWRFRLVQRRFMGQRI